MDKMMDHLPHLQTVADEDVREIQRKEQTYQGSWRRGGGVNAWHMARRKYDRLAVMLAPLSKEEVDQMRSYAAACGEIGPGDTVTLPVDAYVGMQQLLKKAVDAEDIFHAMDSDTSGDDGTVLAEVRDLRRYLLLFEARLMAEQSKPTIDIRKPGFTQPDLYDLVSGDTGIPRYAIMGLLRSVYPNEDNDEASLRLAGLEIVDETVGPPHPGYKFSQIGIESVLTALSVIKMGNTDRLVPRYPDPVPVGDSNKHAERDNVVVVTHDLYDSQATMGLGDRTVPRPLISAELYHKLSPKVRELFLLLGKNAVADRNKMAPEIVSAMTRYRTMISTNVWNGCPDWMREMYVIDGDHYVMRPDMRSRWSR